MLLSTVVILLLTTAILSKLCSRLPQVYRSRRIIAKLPSPPGARWLTGHIGQDPMGPGLQWLRDTVRDFPRVHTLWLGPAPHVIFTHPDTAKSLLSASTGSVKSAMYGLFKDWLGESLAIADGPIWNRNRRLLNKSFSFDVLRTYGLAFNDCTEVLLTKMRGLAETGQAMQVETEMGLCSFDIILRTAFSKKSGCQLEKPPHDGEHNMLTATKTMTRIVQARLTNPLLCIPFLFRWSSMYPEWKKAVRYARGVANQLAERRRAELEHGKHSKPRDFLDTLFLARDEDGKSLTNLEIVNEVNAFLFGGHDTTSSTLTWLLYLLAKHPEHQDKVRDEVDGILTNRDSDFVDSKDLVKMEYLSRVIKETIRMYPPVPLPSRTLTSPYEVDGVTLPAGTDVMVNLYQLHHNAAVWGPDHMEFRPSRFLPENIAVMSPFAYIPFSAGPRNCIGMQFALNSTRVIVARVLRRFRLSLVPGEPEPVPNVNILLKPLREFSLKVERRQPALSGNN